MKILTVSNLTKHFIVNHEAINAFNNVNFEIEEGRFCGIIGPSGCGKSTLLRIIAGLDKPTRGTLNWEKNSNIGFVFQNYALFPYLTVFENIEFGLSMQGVTKKEREKTVNGLIQEVGLNGFETKHPRELSGGMKQRVGIARSLAVNPNVLLLDEPFSSLDEFTAETLRKLLLEIWQKRGITVLMVTHLVSEALELSDSIIVMTPNPGTVKIIIENPLKRPRNLRSTEFFALEDRLVNLVKVDKL